MRNILRVLSSAALLAALVFPSRAQHLGDVSLSTASTNLATNLACTGAAQNFITGVTPNFNNEGQIRHFLSVGSIVGTQTFRAEIDGIDNQGSVYRISDIMEFAGITVNRQGTLVGLGAYPRIQVSITCSPGTGTFTASYSGDFGSSSVNAGAYLTAQLDHVNFFNVNGLVGQQENGVQTPFGSSASTLYVQFITSSSAGNSVSVSCGAIGITGTIGFVFSATLANTVALQSFSIPAAPCPFMNVQYNAAGGGGNGITIETVYTPPGLATSNNGSAVGAGGSDPCQSPNLSKLSQPINIVAAGTTTLVSLGSNLAIYVCGGFMTVASSATTPATVQFIAGTGATCGTGTVTLTGTMGTGTATAGIDAEPVVLPAGATNFRAPYGNALCVVAAGTTVNIQGYISYVQQGGQ